jgi:hypothetical protein
MQTSQAMAALSSPASRERASAKTTSIDGLASGKLRDGLFETRKLPALTNSSPVVGREFIGGSSQGPMRAAIPGPTFQSTSTASAGGSIAGWNSVETLPRAAATSSDTAQLGQNAFNTDPATKPSSSIAAGEQSLATPRPAPPLPPAVQYSTAQAATVADALSAESSGRISPTIAGAMSGSLQLSKNATVGKQPVVPSHLPVLSFITRGGRELAIDSAGALFRSEDAGQTWQVIPTQWRGRAVEVTVTSHSDQPVPANETSMVPSPKVAAKASVTVSAQS